MQARMEDVSRPGALPLNTANLSLPSFQQRSQSHVIATFLKDQQSYLKYYTSEGAKESAKWDTSDVAGPSTHGGAGERAATSVDRGNLSSPILKARVDTKGFRSGPIGEETRGDINGTKEKVVEVEPSRSKAATARRAGYLSGAPLTLPADAQDEHTSRLAERRERRRAKAAILKPAVSPPKLKQTHKRKPPPQNSTTSTPSKNTDTSEPHAMLHDTETKEKRAKGKKKQKLIPPAVALIHTLAPNNLGRERLTLRPQSSVGVFNKGKASAKVVVKSKGKPDRVNTLAFSESKFFNKVLPDRSDRSATPPRQTEISKFFAPVKSGKENQRPGSDEREKRERVKKTRSPSSSAGRSASSVQQSPSSPLEVDDRSPHTDSHQDGADTRKERPSIVDEKHVLSTIGTKWRADKSRIVSTDSAPQPARTAEHRGLSPAQPIRPQDTSLDARPKSPSNWSVSSHRRVSTKSSVLEPIHKRDGKLPVVSDQTKGVQSSGLPHDPTGAPQNEVQTGPYSKPLHSPGLQPLALNAIDDLINACDSIRDSQYEPQPLTNSTRRTFVPAEVEYSLHNDETTLSYRPHPLPAAQAQLPDESYLDSVESISYGSEGAHELPWQDHLTEYSEDIYQERPFDAQLTRPDYALPYDQLSSFQPDFDDRFQHGDVVEGFSADGDNGYYDHDMEWEHANSPMSVYDDSHAPFSNGSAMQPSVYKDPFYDMAYSDCEGYFPFDAHGAENRVEQPPDNMAAPSSWSSYSPSSSDDAVQDGLPGFAIGRTLLEEGRLEKGVRKAEMSGAVEGLPSLWPKHKP